MNGSVGSCRNDCILRSVIFLDWRAFLHLFTRLRREIQPDGNMDLVGVSILRLPQNSRVQATGTAEVLYVMAAGDKKMPVGTNTKRTKLFDAVSVSLSEAHASSFEPSFCPVDRPTKIQVMSRLQEPARSSSAAHRPLVATLRKVSFSPALRHGLNGLGTCAVVWPNTARRFRSRRPPMSVPSADVCARAERV